MEFTSIYEKFAFHLSSPHDDGEGKILQVLSRHALAFLERETSLKLHRLMAANHPKGWEHQPYGKTLISLTTYDSSDTALRTLSVLLNCMRDPFMPAALAERHLSCLMRIGGILLSPENTIVQVHGLDQYPFFTVQHTVQYHAMGYIDTRTDRLLAYLLEIAEGHERQQSQEKANGGAIYWQLILSLKLVLLHHTMASSTASRPGYQYAESLASLVNYVSQNKWYHAGFPHRYADYLVCTTDNKMHIEDFILACRTLSQPPLCPSELGTMDRTLCLETAVAVLQAHRREIDLSTAGTKLVEELMSEWVEDPDGALRWLALTWRKNLATRG
ncbi:hypothetical protein SERLA73DRAFT_179633 [Serpula lacrymans var. lacrymans S7.3]|uniref:Uncharacterized protein n=2 Tax=Serpula lacrymans var. lacrymans TaxID=341189 RepID=F8PVV6_SERL3|nr:uncharacterized protein SERLADRAFT_464830 [Serpula lacrymans var. lacrymans S7.9]EGN99552.1 hypothetical protein SERLA73DRAFT_179633 [Serpula lacrymans var. lacrymans S7.3]EGO25123.1 hypothetical protein SERLADRAFT_464830 [Serpula lacrymans var. lacrymans S7.9]